MKKFFLLLVAVFLISSTGIYSQSVTFNVTTVTDNGSFSPKHILAIWVKNSNGVFVKSIKVNAATRIQYLYSWNKSSAGNKTDAITGATLTAHQAHSVTWNCKNTSGNVVPNGTYKMMIEYTDQHAQGPKDSLVFSVSGSPQHLTQTDQSYFKNISLDFTPATTGIEENSVTNQVLSIYPNPSIGLINVSLSSEESGKVTLNIFDIKGKKVHEETIQSDKLNNYPIKLESLSKGLYILELNVNGKKISQKVVFN